MKSIVSIGLLLVFAGSFLGGCSSLSTQPSAPHSPTDEEIILRCRSKTVSVDQVDAQLGEWIQWKRLRAKLKPGDELWKFRTAGPTWEKMMGWEGYALFRNDKLVGSVTTREN